MGVRAGGSLGRLVSGGTCLRVLSAQCRRLDSIILIALLFAGCAKAPPSLTPVSLKVWQANEVVNVIGAVEQAAIAFNGQTVCSADPVPVCSPMLSEQATRIVVSACVFAIRTIQAYPDGWYATGLSAVTQIESNLGAAGQTRMLPYLATVRIVLANLVQAQVTQ